MDEKTFCLKWSNYTDVLRTYFAALLNFEYLTDVTLSCDNQSLKCHRIVLSASSPYFHNLLVSNSQSHLIIVLKDVKFCDLQALMKFIYTGEVMVSQAQLRSLIKLGDTLKVTGLCDTGEPLDVIKETNCPSEAVDVSKQLVKRRRIDTDPENSVLGENLLQCTESSVSIDASGALSSDINEVEPNFLPFQSKDYQFSSAVHSSSSTVQQKDFNETNPVEHIRVENSPKVIEPAMTDDQFQEVYRLSRTTFQILKDMLIQEKVCKEMFPSETLIDNERPEHPVPFEKALLMTLWYLGSAISIGKIALTFEVAESTVSRCIKKLCRVIDSLGYKFVVWPTSAEDIAKTEQDFVDCCGIKRVIGAVNCCHIRINCNHSQHQESYTNKNGYTSTILQGICNANKMFTSFFSGLQGSNSNATVFLRSRVGQKIILNQTELVPSGKHILADSTYPLTKELLKPFENKESLTEMQKRYNVNHFSGRICIEKAFSLLKGRWRRLLCVDCDPSFVSRLIASCCILHNICIANKDKFQPQYVEDLDSSPLAIVEPEAHNVIDKLPDKSETDLLATTTAKRDGIAASLWTIVTPKELRGTPKIPNTSVYNSMYFHPCS
ncbi:uncharacterized protein LOC136043873 isoform X2 [Artemia franciscana]|uniref:BTB domain-containing protein n=1 Tax=Artemia franciscana TaxID=6661 RepID=A0AA88HU01_ARTSF|nr:hypothetical protein QYM36_010644 [Artemia franciscana]